MLVTVDTADSFIRSANTNSKVIQTVECTNGYIHVVDTVLLPYEVRAPTGRYLNPRRVCQVPHHCVSPTRLPLGLSVPMGLSLALQGKVVPFGPGSESKDAGLASFNKVRAPFRPTAPPSDPFAPSFVQCLHIRSNPVWQWHCQDPGASGEERYTGVGKN